MEIIVQGKGIEYITPDKVVLNINFIKKEKSYEEALESGTLNVRNFIEEILLKNGFKSEDLKTRSFTIRKDTKYNQYSKKYEFDGYSFSQMATLKFYYDKEKIAKIMQEISKLDNAPMCQINFGVENERECKRKILDKAYKDAEEQANAIAEASGKVLKQCVKVDFKPFTTDFISKAKIESDIMCAKKFCEGSAQTIVNTFTPEDIELSETLYCLWLAE